MGDLTNDHSGIQLQWRKLEEWADLFSTFIAFGVTTQHHAITAQCLWQCPISDSPLVITEEMGMSRQPSVYYYPSTAFPVTGTPVLYFTSRPTTHISCWFDWAYIDMCVIIALGLLVLSVCISFSSFFSGMSRHMPS